MRSQAGARRAQPVVTDRVARADARIRRQMRGSAHSRENDGDSPRDGLVDEQVEAVRVRHGAEPVVEGLTVCASPQS